MFFYQKNNQINYVQQYQKKKQQTQFLFKKKIQIYQNLNIKNKMQDQPSEKQSIQVTIRVRPLNKNEKQESQQTCIKFNQQQPNSIQLETSSQSNLKTFQFDYIAHQYTTQQEIFQKIALPAVDNCFEGYNACIFAYGQTGAGKTFTITGSSDLEQVLETENRGLLPRVLENIFVRINNQKSQKNVEYLVKCSYLEIYNEHIIDLLSNNQTSLQLREDLKKGVFVENLTEQITRTLSNAIEVLKKGGKNRHIGFTSMNRESSRSHTVFSIILESKSVQEGITQLRFSHFNLVDLAGSERTKQGNIKGERLREGCNINRSLSILGNVINSLVEIDGGKSRHIHYRDSKLTFFLKDCIGGNSKTRFIANISPFSGAFQETVSTLKFAQRVKLIKNKVQINEDNSGNAECLNNQIKKLKLENLQFKQMILQKEI
ncbi:kinesin motor domain protein, partial [Ichthyophthirius multifiliis]